MIARRSLRVKIAAAILVASLLPSLAAVWLLARAGEANLRSAAQAEARTAGTLARSLAAERASRLLAQAQAVALTPGMSAAVAARDRPAIMALARPWLETLGGATLAITDERGVMVLRTYAPDRYGDDMTGTTKGLLPALRGEPTSSTEAAGLRGLAIRGFGPIRHDGRVVGVAAVTQNLDQEFLGALRAAIGHETFAVFPDGSAVGAVPSAATAAAIAGARQEYTGLADAGSDERAVYAWPLTDPDGTVVGFLGVVFRLDELAEARAQVRGAAAVAALVALLASGLLVWQLSRAVVRPVGRLTGAARAIAAGAAPSIPAVRSGDELEELSAALATMVATLSDQARRLETLNAGLAAERGRAQALAEASRAFAEARLDVQAVLAAVARRVAELLDGGCVVRELSADGRWLTPVAFHHTDPEAFAVWREMFAAPHRADEGVNARAVRTGRTQFLARLTPEEVRATLLPEHWPYLERIGIHSLLVVPLRVGGRIIGTVAVQRTVPDRPFVEEDAEFLRDLGDRAALAIENARLYGELQQRVEEQIGLNSALRELAEARDRARAETQAIIEQLPLSTQILAPDGTTLAVNRAWERLWGVTFEQIRGYNVLEDPQLVEKGVMSHVRRAFEGEPAEIPAIRYEPELTIPDTGAVPYRWVRAFIFPVKDDAGVVREVVLIHEDVTDQRQAEEAREAALVEAERQRDEAERARGSLQTFLGIVAHDLRGPLTTIRATAQILRRRGADDPERQTRGLQAIDEQAGRMNAMVGSLIDAARIGSDQLEVRPEPTDLVALARRAVEAAQAATDRHRIVLEGPERLEGSWDAGRLGEVLDNLLGNAVKYSPAGGEVRLRLERQGSEAVISVADQGIGFRPEDVPRLFELFSRLDESGRIEGSGLGLYITRGIVEAHGGRVCAKSAGPAQGATFVVALPVGG